VKPRVASVNVSSPSTVAKRS